jgi:hypothetical protein
MQLAPSVLSKFITPIMECPLAVDVAMESMILLNAYDLVNFPAAEIICSGLLVPKLLALLTI